MRPRRAGLPRARRRDRPGGAAELSTGDRLGARWRGGGSLIRGFGEREALGSTGIGDGVAIPHCKLAGLRQVRLAVGVARARRGVRRRRRPAGAGLFFALVSPEPTRPPRTCSSAGRDRALGPATPGSDRGAGVGRATRRAIARPARTGPALPAAAGRGGSVAEERTSWSRELLGEELSDLHLTVLCGRAAPRQPDHPSAGAEAGPRLRRLLRLHQARAGADRRRERARVPEHAGARRAARTASSTITALPIPVFVVTKGLEPLPDFLDACRAREVPVLVVAGALVDGHQARSATSSRTTWSPRRACTACCSRSTGSACC